MYAPEEILKITVEAGYKKVKKDLKAKFILGFIGGAMISLGYLAYIRVAASVAEQWGSFASFLGACVFPIGLIVILLAGGELVTGNIMAVSAAFIDKKVTFKELISNWIVITISNIIGAVFTAYVFGHIVGLTSSGVYLHEVSVIANAKLAASPLQCFFSGIGCNWFVGLALWLCYGAKGSAGKILAIWFPVMTFVAIGFQHSVANMFLLPAAAFEGVISWTSIPINFIPVYLGNIIGGAVFVSLFYHKSYKH